MRIGTPPSSVNCLVDAGFLPLVRGAEAIRVPKPAAGTITITFIAGCKYTRARAAVQIASPSPEHRSRTGFTLTIFCSDLGTLFPTNGMSRRPHRSKPSPLNNLHLAMPWQFSCIDQQVGKLEEKLAELRSAT